MTRPRKRKTAGHQPAGSRRPPARRQHRPPGPPGTGGALLQPGRRPSSPGLLLAVALMWIAAGIMDLVALKASWKLIPGIVSIGIGLLFLRGAAATVARRADRGR